MDYTEGAVSLLVNTVMIFCIAILILLMIIARRDTIKRVDDAQVAAATDRLRTLLDELERTPLTENTPRAVPKSDNHLDTAGTRSPFQPYQEPFDLLPPPMPESDDKPDNSLQNPTDVDLHSRLAQVKPNARQSIHDGDEDQQPTPLISVLAPPPSPYPEYAIIAQDPNDQLMATSSSPGDTGLAGRASMLAFHDIIHHRDDVVQESAL